MKKACSDEIDSEEDEILRQEQVQSHIQLSQDSGTESSAHSQQNYYPIAAKKNRKQRKAKELTPVCFPRECNNSRISNGSQTTMTQYPGSAMNFCEQTTGKKCDSSITVSGEHSIKKDKEQPSGLNQSRKTLELTKITTDSQVGEFNLEEKDQSGLMQNDYSSILPISLDQIKVEVEEEHEIINSLTVSHPEKKFESNCTNTEQKRQLKQSTLFDCKEGDYERFGSEIQKLQLELLVKSSMEEEKDDPEIQQFFEHEE